MLKIFYAKPVQKKKVLDTRVEIKDLPVVREVLCNNTDLAISLVLTTFGNKPKKFDCIHQTIFLPGGTPRLGTRL